MPSPVQPFNARLAVFNKANSGITRYTATPDNLEVLEVREANHPDYNTVLSIRINVYPDIPEDELLPSGAVRYSKRMLNYNRKHIVDALDSKLSLVDGNHQLIDSSLTPFNETTVAAFLTSKGIAISANEVKLKKSATDKWLIQMHDSLNYYGAVTVATTSSAAGGGDDSQPEPELSPEGHVITTSPSNDDVRVELNGAGDIIYLRGYTSPNTQVVVKFEDEIIFDVMSDQYGDLIGVADNEYVAPDDVVIVTQSQASSGKSITYSTMTVYNEVQG